MTTDPTPPATQAPPSTPDLVALLGVGGAPRGWTRWLPWVLTAVVVLAAAVAGVYWRGQAPARQAPAYVTEAARIGDLTLSVAANGTLQPTRTVNIGSELSGTVKRVQVDVNDRVRRGQVLTELDTAKLSDQVTRSRAALASAQALVVEREATRQEAGAALTRLEALARMSDGQVPAASELDSARAAQARAQAAWVSALAGVDEARAAASTDETNLAKSSIRSPIDGVVLSRSVDPGNAVAASLQAVTLFVVAEDLASLRLEVAVDEADVGVVRVGQKASFTVSAYPARHYPATIRRVAYGSTKTDGVVTYVTELQVDNRDMSLRPGMTASATVVADERAGVLLVPNTALRFAPQLAGEATPASSAPASASILSRLMPRPPRAARGSGAAHPRGEAAPGDVERTLWVLRDGQALAVAVRTGISDGRLTEVTGGDLHAGDAVITDQRSSEEVRR